MQRVVECNSARTAGRLSKAEQFERAAADLLLLADDERAASDAYVTLAVHAGVAAADVLCCVDHGIHSRGSNHGEAVALLATRRPKLAKHLGVLLAMKPAAGYGSHPVSTVDRVRAERAMDALMNAARASVGG